MSYAVGPFELIVPIGAGGMGQVWRGRHRGTGHPVAIKTVHQRAGSDDRFRRGFMREVRSMARLSHPNVARIHAAGQVSRDDAARAPEVLHTGSPYLAMELATHGSLFGADFCSSWADVRSILLQVLDALATAHALGIVHRDLKPGNVLLTVDSDAGARVLLGDFGIAHAAVESARDADDPSLDLSTGTPGYMPPEQLRGEWRDYGPWTDIYALGCMAYELVSGHPPFTGSLAEVLQKQLESPFPTPDTRFAVPPGFRAWLDRATAKRPRQRFLRAADAAWALVQLGAVDDDGPRALEQLARHVPAPQTPVDQLAPTAAAAIPDDDQTRMPAGQSTRAAALRGPTADAAGDATTAAIDEASLRRLLPHIAGDARPHTLAPLENLFAATLEAVEAGPSLPMFDGSASALVTGPPVPRTWRGAEEHQPVVLPGVGLSLLNVRSVPLVGRVRERDVIWETFTAALADDQPAAVLIRGPAGRGKSRLAEWMLCRANELGVSTTLRARHSPRAPRGDALRRMLLLGFQAHGLGRRDTRDRLYEYLRDYAVPSELSTLVDAEIRPLQRFLSGRKRRKSTPSPGEARFAILTRVLRRLALERPLAIWLDDAHEDPESLRFVRHVLRLPAPARFPVVFLVTLRDDRAEAVAGAGGAIEELVAEPACLAMELGGLDEADETGLLDELAGLEPDLRAAAAAIAGGSPLVAVQLVGELAERGALAPGARGYKLVGDTELPTTLSEIWSARVARALAYVGDPDRALDALRCGAALGNVFSLGEWAASLGGVDVAAYDDIFLATGLWRADDELRHFAHGTLSEQLLAEAAAAGRLPQILERCARGVEATSPVGTPGRAARIGILLADAGEYEQAAPFLTDAARERFDDADFAGTIRMVDAVFAHVEDTLAANLRAELRILRAEALRLSWRFADAREEAERAVAAATEAASTEREADALYALGSAQWYVGELAEGAASLRRAIELREKLGDACAVARASVRLATVLEDLGEMKQAMRLLDDALDVFEAHDDHRGIAEAHEVLGSAFRQLGEMKSSRHHYDTGRIHFEKLGDDYACANCINGLGEVARHSGALDEAEGHYEAALARYDQIGSEDRVIPLLGWALARLGSGDAVRAREAFEEALAALERHGQAGFVPFATVGLAAAATLAEDFREADEWLRRARRELEALGVRDIDISYAAEIASDAARKSGAHEVAADFDDVAQRYGPDA